MKMLKMMDDQAYDMTMDLIKGYADGLKANNTVKEELFRNAGIHAMQFMLAAKHFGFDTCPMHIHNIDELKKNQYPSTFRANDADYNWEKCR